MKSRFKFRAWNGRAMEYGGFSVHATGNLKIDFPDRINEHDPIMQFTGLKDVNGKDIYESDILSYGFNNQVVVKWGDIMFEGGYNTPGFGLYFLKSGEQIEDYHCQWKHLEIVGNIYEGVRNEEV